MKKLLVMTLLVVCMLSVVFAGGIVTNTNQSAAYMRTLNRNASTDADAIYYNPAATANFCDGLYLGVSNQSIFQTKTVDNSYQYLNDSEFVGDVTALLFPNFYVAYKTGKLAFSAGFEPIGGGGSAEFEEGLPSFEIPVAGLKEQLGTEYRLYFYFQGSSIYYGAQAGVAYKVNEMVSVAGGVRFVSASNHYEGYLKDIQVQSSSGWVDPGTYLTGVANQFDAAAQSLQPIIDANAGGMTLSQLQTGGYLTTDEVAALEGGLQQAGVDPSGMTAAEVQGAYNTLYTQTAAQVPVIEAATADKEVDADQKASGITPIFSVFLKPNDKMGLAIRYEMKTNLELENETKTDDTGMFPDGAKTRADMPAMLALGLYYQVMPALRTEFNLSYYMNTGVDWEGKEDYVENGMEIGMALEYGLSEKLKASLGFLYSNSGAEEGYQTDLSYSLNSTTLGLGVAYQLTPKMMLNIGGLNTFYQEGQKQTTGYTEEYMKTTTGFAVGLDLKL